MISDLILHYERNREREKIIAAPLTSIIYLERIPNTGNHPLEVHPHGLIDRLPTVMRAIESMFLHDCFMTL
jgi:hypothetical protein